VSVSLASEGFAVLATGPDPDRDPLDIDGHARDFRAAIRLWRDGRLEVDKGRWMLMGGSFGSLVMFRALRDLPEVPAIVTLGGIGDAFLAVNSLYDEAIEVPPYYEKAVASLGRPDDDPALFFAHSPVFFADRLPPTLLVHTCADEVIPCNQAVAFDAALGDTGTPHELLLYEDTTHYLNVYEPTESTYETYERIVEFARQHTR
jgi:dipeptidyl aminopeptidase/acylaminoacyl peptidase